MNIEIEGVDGRICGLETTQWKPAIMNWPDESITLRFGVIAMKNEKKTAEVKMVSMAFSPASITIRPGDSVVWKNEDLTEHNAQRDDEPGSFETRLLHFGEKSSSIEFPDAGTFPYFCRPHKSSMQGEVVVSANDDACGE